MFFHVSKVYIESGSKGFTIVECGDVKSFSSLIITILYRDIHKISEIKFKVITEPITGKRPGPSLGHCI